MRRARLLRMVRTRLRLDGVPAVVKPARRQLRLGVSLSVVLTRLGSSRSSKKMSRNSSWSGEFEIVLASPLSSGLAALPRAAAAAALRGRLILSPATNSLLPGST
jgi:hypothetical protein